jgi:hypothetical protein
MEKQRILYLSRVTFQLPTGPEHMGSFCLYSISDDLRFEWTPSDPTTFAGSDLSVAQSRIVIRLAKVTQIIRNDESLQTVSLQFVRTLSAFHGSASTRTRRHRLLISLNSSHTKSTLRRPQQIAMYSEYCHTAFLAKMFLKSKDL